MGKRAGAKNKGRGIQVVVVFRLRQEEFGVEIGPVLEISPMLAITRIPHAPHFIEGVIELRGQVIAVINLARQFGLAEQKGLPKTARIVVVRIAQETLGLIVDEAPEVLWIAEEHIEPTPEIIQTKVKRDYITGVAKLGERLIILLNLNNVLAAEEIDKVEEIKTSVEREA